MKRRVPVEGGREAGLRGGDWGERGAGEWQNLNIWGGRKDRKRGLYRMLFIMRCDREMEWRKVGHFHFKQEVEERLRSRGRDRSGDSRVNRRKLNT